MSRTTEGHIYTPTSGHSTGLTTDAVVSSSREIKSSYDVIVIGAGFAGLVAARDLSKDKDLSVLLLEARDRIGGRTWTAKAWGENFEMGGTWIHWCQPHVYSEVSRYSLHKSLKTTAGTAAMEEMYFKPRGSRSPAQKRDLTGFEEKIERLAADFFAVDGNSAQGLMPFPHEPLRSPSQSWTKYDHLSVKDRLDQLKWPAEDKDLIETNFNTLGCGTGDVTAFTEALRWYALGGYSMAGFEAAAGTFKLGNGGMTNFARHILDEFTGDRMFGAAVKAISQDGRGVRVVMGDGKTVTAQQVVCTIPLNCLKDIDFKPPVSAIRNEGIQRGHMNIGAKIHYHLKEVQPGWGSSAADPQDSALLFGMSDHNGTKSEQPNGTFCIGFGYNGHLKDPQNDEEFISALQDLRPDSTVQGYLTHPWATDEFAQGAWYCASPGMTTMYLEEMQKPHGRVFFASADWAHGWRGFVDGAIEQGQRAALHVAKGLKAEEQGANGIS